MYIDEIETLWIIQQGKDLEEMMRATVARTEIFGFQSSLPWIDLLLGSLVLYLFPDLIDSFYNKTK